MLEQRVEAGAGVHADEERFGVLGAKPGEGVGVKQVGLVEDRQGGAVGGTEFAQHRERRGMVLVDVGVGRVEEVDEEVGDDDLLERGLEGLDETVRQAADEADGVGQQQGAAVGQGELTGGRVEGGEELVGGEHLRAGELVEQGGLAGVGVADDGGAGDGGALALDALRGALGDDLGQLRLKLGDAVADEAAVLLKLRLAFAPHLALAALTGKVRPRAGQAGQGIFHAGQRDLQHGLAGLRPVGENLQYHLLPVDDGEAGLLFPVALLGGREFLVEHDDVGAVRFGAGDQFGGLAAADEEFRLVAVAQIDEGGVADLQAEVLNEFVQLREQFRSLAWLHVRGLHADEQSAGGGSFALEEIGHG